MSDAGLVVLQPTGGTVDAPGTGWSTAASGHGSLAHLHPHSVPDLFQVLHQPIRRESHAALVTLLRLMVVVASPAEIGTGFGTHTSGPVRGSACGDNRTISLAIFLGTF